jgi:hypothetical protein
VPFKPTPFFTKRAGCDFGDLSLHLEKSGLGIQKSS